MCIATQCGLLKKKTAIKHFQNQLSHGNESSELSQCDASGNLKQQPDYSV